LIAVCGKTNLYSVKINKYDDKAIISKINRKTGKVTNLTTKNNKKYVTFLGQANDMPLC
jgi:hypothetical protein